jgi:hypothetical protein
MFKCLYYLWALIHGNLWLGKIRIHVHYLVIIMVYFVIDSCVSISPSRPNRLAFMDFNINSASNASCVMPLSAAQYSIVPVVFPLIAAAQLVFMMSISASLYYLRRCSSNETFRSCLLFLTQVKKT